MSGATIRRWRVLAMGDALLMEEVRQFAWDLGDALDKTLLPADLLTRVTAGILLNDFADQLPRGLAGHLKAVRNWQ